MPPQDDDPVTPRAVAGVFRDAHEVGRVVQVFAVSVTGATDPNAIDAATLLAVEMLAERADIDASAGSITVLMNGETAGVIVAQPLGAPALKPLGEALVKTLAARFAGAQVALGMATTAEHKELQLDDALSVAIEGLEVASASGSNRAVHSELYELTLATRRRQGTVFPLESVRHGESFGGPGDGPDHGPDQRADDYIPRPDAGQASVGTNGTSHSYDERIPAAPIDSETNGRAEVLGEFDDPFAHLASEAYELNSDSARALTNGIAPKSEAVAQLEQESRAEVERLRLELEVARREKLASDGNGAANSIQERRIHKLVEQLEGAEAEIARLREDQEGDRGVGSAYKSVQGLDPSEPKTPAKRILIDGVFEANRPEDPKVG